MNIEGKGGKDVSGAEQRAGAESEGRQSQILSSPSEADFICCI